MRDGARVFGELRPLRAWETQGSFRAGLVEIDLPEAGLRKIGLVKTRLAPRLLTRYRGVSSTW